MRKRRVVETREDRMSLAQEAGFGALSLGSVLAGVLVAYGAFAVFAAIVAAVMDAVGVDTTNLSSNDWRNLGIGGSIAAALLLLVSYLYGGYVAGRMARRAGPANGLLVSVLGIVVAIAVGAALGSQTDATTVESNLRSIGVPTTGSEWTAIGLLAAAGMLLAILVGGIVGGLLGERWHGKLLTRAADPGLGPTAAARRDAEDAEQRATEARQREIDLRDGTVEERPETPAQR